MRGDSFSSMTVAPSKAHKESNELAEDLKKLKALAYRRLEYSEDDIRRYHELLKKKGPVLMAPLAKLHRWMLVPVTLWPIHLQPVFVACLDAVDSGKPLDAELNFLISQLHEPPGEEACDVVAEHERLVWKGGYESLVNTAAKFDSIQKDAERDPGFLREWREIKSQWDVKKFTDSKGIIRRSLTGERNLRARFWVDWSDPKDRFQAVFDLFCHRWNLYGMEKEKPLVMKLSVNLTAFGTMIFIPAYWSFDAKRDVRWDAVTKLHRTRALKKQGEGLAESAEKRRSNAAKLKKLDVLAKELKLRGEARHAFLCKGLGLDERTDAKRLARLRREF